MHNYICYFGGEAVQETCFRKLEVFSNIRQMILTLASSYWAGEKLPFISSIRNVTQIALHSCSKETLDYSSRKYDKDKMGNKSGFGPCLS